MCLASLHGRVRPDRASLGTQVLERWPLVERAVSVLLLEQLAQRVGRRRALGPAHHRLERHRWLNGVAWGSVGWRGWWALSRLTERQDKCWTLARMLTPEEPGVLRPGEAGSGYGSGFSATRLAHRPITLTSLHPGPTLPTAHRHWLDALACLPLFPLVSPSSSQAGRRRSRLA